MNENENEQLPVGKIFLWIFMAIFLIVSIAGMFAGNEKARYQPPEKEKFADDDEKLIYGLLRMQGFDDEESRDAVINTRGDYR